jgi:hypothetical protein
MNTQRMGLGLLGDHNIVYDRPRIRWTVSGIFGDREFGPFFVKVNSRPTLELLQDKETDYLSAKTWIPGAASWQTTSTTFRDLPQDTLIPFYDIIRDSYESQKNEFKEPLYTGTVKIQMHSGSMLLETWTLLDAYPDAIHFNELDCTDSDLNFEVVWKYKDVRYEPGKVTPQRPAPTLPSDPAPTASTS